MADYFTKETDEYIKNFLCAETDEKKHALFNEGIRPAFEKLIENLIYVYKFFNLDDVETLKQDCLANLYIILPKFDPEKAELKGTKGFSYFNVVAKNWFVQKARERTKKNRIEKELHVDLNKDAVKTNPALTYSHHEDSVLEKEFWMSFFNEMEMWKTKMVKKNERKVLDAIIFLLNNSELAPIYSKKAVYLYIREMTNLNEKQVAMILKKLRSQYFKFKNRYYEEGK